MVTNIMRMMIYDFVLCHLFSVFKDYLGEQILIILSVLVSTTIMLMLMMISMPILALYNTSTRYTLFPQ